MNELMTLELPSGLGLGPIADIAEWRETGERLASAHKAVNWLIGDWWNAGEPYGDRVAEAARIFPHVSHDTMRTYGSMSGKFEQPRRRATLDWAVHREVSALSAEAADRLLDLAETNRWSTRQIAERVVCARADTLPRWMPTRETATFDRIEAKEAIFTRLVAAAASGDMCPTADELAEISGVGSVSTTVALMHVLEAEQRIDVQRFQRGRVVTIRETGDSTAQPSDTSPHWRERPRELPTPAPQAINRDKPTIAANIFAAARAKGQSPQDYLAHLVWLGWEVECAIDSAAEAREARDAA